MIVVTRDAPAAATACLDSIAQCTGELAARGGVEFILADDCSSPTSDPTSAFPALRSRVPYDVTAFRFRKRMHYVGTLSRCMSLARGDVLFLSHDMILTPACVAELFELADREPTYGVLRPRSGHMDFANKMSLAGPASPGYEQAAMFAETVRAQARGQAVPWPVLIGDAMYVRREVLDRVGVLDARFYGFYGDVDYGVRVHRAGWKHGIAAGAWLHHSGATSGHEPCVGPEDERRRWEEMLGHAGEAWEVFRHKWGMELPADRSALTAAHLRGLRALPAMTGGYQPPVPLDPSDVDLIAG